MMLDDQRMTMPAAHCAQHGRATAQRERMDEIEHVLEKTGIASLINRATDDQSIAMFNL